MTSLSPLPAINDIRLVNGDVTNAYGNIEFVGGREETTSKYIRIGSQTNPEHVIRFMREMWKLKIPNLIISVTGGAANFNMKSNLTKTFRKSLIKAAESTGSWIVSGGTHSGVMLHVGKAVKEYAHVTENQQVVALGIATWGVIHNHDQLLNSSRQSISHNALFELEKPASGYTSLDKNHSHFILVDDGSEKSFGKEIEFRARLEAHLAQQTSINGVRTLNVCLIVQGGPNSLKTAYSAMKEDIPVVVVAGSGGWASILSSVHHKNHTDITEVLIHDLLEEQGMLPRHPVVLRPQDLSYWTNMTRECVLMKRKITIFQTDSTDDSVRDLDVAILQSILTNNSNTDMAEEQLKLCLAWNRSDIARDYIFNDESCLSEHVLKTFFIEAFVQNRHEFVGLFLQFGVSRQLNYDEILEIYRKILDDESSGNLLRRMTSSYTSFNYFHVSRLARRMLGPSFISNYPASTSRSQSYQMNLNENNSSKSPRPQRQQAFGWNLQNSSVRGRKGASGSGDEVDGMKELFFICLLLNWHEMSLILWRILSDPLSASIAAFRVLKSISKSSHVKEEEESLQLHLEEYRRLTIGLLDECYGNDKYKTCILLTRCLPRWGELTCLRMMVDAHDMDLVAHPSVQYVLNDIWMGGMDKDTDIWTVTVGCCFPGLIPFMIQFDPVMKKDDADGEEVPKERGFFDKIFNFYSSPVVGFGLNTISYMMFLLLFAIVLLFNLPTTTPTSGTSLSIAEIFLVIWISILFADEVNEIAEKKRNKELIKRLRLWINNNWNKLDLLGLVLYIVGFVLRFISIESSRILLCLAFIVYSIRLLHIFAIHRALGPKIIMVGKMIRDLVFFMFILLVFLVAYGVVRQSLLYPDENRIGQAIIGVFNKPYWNIYGELFLEEINYNPTEDEFTCSSVESDIAAGFQPCPQQQAAVPVLSAIYLLFANVLLLNLLIAMFTYSFDNLIENSDKIWKLQLYELIEEYYYKPPLFTPLSILSHIYTFITYLLSLCSRKTSNKLSTTDDFHGGSGKVIYDDFKRSSSNAERLRLNVWLRWCVDAYMVTSHDRDDVETNVSKINDRIDTVMLSLEGIVRNLASQKKMKRRVKNLEKKLINSTEALDWIMSALKDNSTFPKSSNKPVHIKARSSPYPHSSINRFEVPQHLVSWTVPWPDYKPPHHTDRIVLNQPIWADVEISNQIQANQIHISYNSFDNKNQIDRTSHMGKYDIVDGFPRNPCGRTGLSGRGLLGRYGPNHAADPIVTRFERDENNKIVVIDDKAVLQFVAVCRHDTGDWAIPGGMVDPGENVSKTLKREFVEEVEITSTSDVNNSNDESHQLILNRVEELLKFGGVEIYRGYCDDFRNTDQAWIETLVMNFHDNDGSIFQHVRLKPGDEASGVKWQRVDRNLQLFASHSKFLKMVAQRHNAYF